MRGVGSNAMPLLQVLCMVAFLFKLYTTMCMFNHDYFNLIQIFIYFPSWPTKLFIGARQFWFNIRRGLTYSIRLCTLYMIIDF